MRVLPNSNLALKPCALCEREVKNSTNKAAPDDITAGFSPPQFGPSRTCDNELSPS